MSDKKIKLKPSLDEFKKLCQEGDIIPVYAERLADIETPVSVLGRFAEEENVFLLESVEKGERFGRYSFLGIHPRGVFTVEGSRAFYSENGTRRELKAQGCPLNALREIIQNKRALTHGDLPPLPGGAIGFIGYECVNQFEELPEPKAKVETPEAAFLITDEMLIFDNQRHTVKTVVCVHPAEFEDPQAAYEYARERISQIAVKLDTPFRPTEKNSDKAVPLLVSNLSRQDFYTMVEKAKEYIQQGEVIQLVLSQCFSAPMPFSALCAYRALRYVNPSPYTFFLKIGDLTLAGSSPETMVKLENGHSSLRPIAGTRKRGSTPAEDMKLADELLRDEKERAEHLMLVDLGRNDLGRTAVPGSVQVKSFMNVERYSHVMHIVSEVDAMLAEEYDAFDLVRTTFPAGTLTGAPKIRAMELIHELEPTPRGVYGGAVGYFSYTGNMDLAITIRTVEIRDQKMHVQTGAGIVYDSVSENEYEETLNKAKALFNAVNLAANDFQLD